MTPWSQRVFVIAEAGVNHDGDMAVARALIDAGANAGADAIKFQLYRTEELVRADAPTADYQRRALGGQTSQFQMLKNLEVSAEDYRALVAYGAARGVLVFATAFDAPSLEVLADTQPIVWKVPSGEITNYPYLARIARAQQPTILSTGMATLGEVEAAVAVLLEHGISRHQLVILHCTSEYPAPDASVNLRAMPLLGAAFQTDFGYSDHTEGSVVALAAVALGARVIEKHLTLDCARTGPDHAASMEPGPFAQLVADIRRTEAILGHGRKEPVDAERSTQRVARKSIVAARDIAAGELLTAENLAVRRPGGGPSPMRWPTLVGTIATRAYRADEWVDQ